MDFGAVERELDTTNQLQLNDYVLTRVLGSQNQQTELVGSELHRSTYSLKPGRVELDVRKCLGKNCTETLLKSYSCAWQKDILVHGRMYLTPHWFCFYSNILGWETKTSIRFADVTSISKQRTALVFPNAILIEAGTKKFGFASVVHRDKVFHVLITIWRNALSPKPLNEAALLVEINNWKQSSKELPSTVASSSFLASDNEDTPHTPTHNHATDSESSHSVLSEHTDFDYPSDRSSSYSATVESADSATDSQLSGNNTDSGSSLSVPPSTQSRHSVQEVQWIKTDLSIPGIHYNFGPFRLTNQCSTTLLINILLIIFIIVLLVSTLTMLCRLSQMEPTLQPYLILQPWCALCSQPSTHI